MTVSDHRPDGDPFTLLVSDLRELCEATRRRVDLLNDRASKQEAVRATRLAELSRAKADVTRQFANKLQQLVDQHTAEPVPRQRLILPKPPAAL